MKYVKRKKGKGKKRCDTDKQHIYALSFFLNQPATCTIFSPYI